MCFDPNRVLVSGKRKLRRLFWRVKAEIRKQVQVGIWSNQYNNNKKKKKFSFHYDPFSYALNFDNGNFGFFC